MAKTVYDAVEINLQDETPVTLVPLAIGRLRRFMDAWKKFAELKDENDAFDIYINCCGIALEKDLADKVTGTRDSDKVLTDEYREYLEEVLDMDTIFKVLEVCGGLNLNDPKLLAAAEEAAQAAAAGTN